MVILFIDKGEGSGWVNIEEIAKVIRYNDGKFKSRIYLKNGDVVKSELTPTELLKNKTKIECS